MVGNGCPLRVGVFPGQTLNERFANAQTNAWMWASRFLMASSPFQVEGSRPPLGGVQSLPA